MSGVLLEVNMELSILCRFVKFLNTFLSNIRIVNHASNNGFNLVWACEKDIERLLNTFNEQGVHGSVVVSMKPHGWLNEWEI